MLYGGVFPFSLSVYNVHKNINRQQQGERKFRVAAEGGAQRAWGMEPTWAKYEL